VWFTCGDIVLSFLAALALSLMFESPILGLEKIFLKKGKKKSNYYGLYFFDILTNLFYNQQIFNILKVLFF
jgi:hypothetical protein